MLRKNKALTFLTLLLLIIAGVTTMARQQDEQKAKNLLVLPKDTGKAVLDTLMKDYSDALGVKCNYCHASLKSNPKELDYASDDKAAKRISREMMKMTAAINQQFFKDHTNDKGESSNAISCISCHNGQEYPAFKK